MNSEFGRGSSTLNIYEHIALQRLGLTMDDISDIPSDYYMKYYKNIELSTLIATMHNEYAAHQRHRIQHEAEKILSGGISLGEFLYFGEPQDLAPLLSDAAMQTLDGRVLLRRMTQMTLSSGRPPANEVAEPKDTTGESSLAASKTLQSMSSQQVKHLESQSDVLNISQDPTSLDTATMAATQKLQQMYMELLKQLQAEKRKTQAEINANAYVIEAIKRYNTTKSPVPKDFNPQEAIKLQEKFDAKIARLRALPELHRQKQIAYYEQQQQAEALIREKVDSIKRNQARKYEERVREHANKIHDIRMRAKIAGDLEFQRQQECLRTAQQDKEHLETMRRAKLVNRAKIQEETARMSQKAAERKEVINAYLNERASKVSQKFSSIDQKLNEVERQKLEKIQKNSQKNKMAQLKAQTFRENLRDQLYLEQTESFQLRQKILEHNLENLKTQKEAEEREKKQREEDRRQENQQRIYERNYAEMEHRLAMQYQQQKESKKSDNFMNMLRQKRDEISMLRFQMENQRGSKRKQTRELIDVKIDELKQMSK